MARSLHVVAGVAVQDGKMLLQKRDPLKLRPAVWENPGGKVEPGETEEVALAREWREELGHDCVVGGLVARVPLRLERHLSVAFYAVTISAPIEDIRAAAEASDIDWIDPIWAVKWLPLSPATYAAFDEMLAHVRRGGAPAPPVDRLVVEDARKVYQARVGNTVRTFLRPSSAYYAIARARLLKTYGLISSTITLGGDLRVVAASHAREGVSDEEFAERVRWVRDNLVGEEGFSTKGWTRAVRKAAAELRAKDGHP